MWARFFDQATARYVVKPLGKVQRVEPGRVLVAGQWHPTTSLGHGLYTSPEMGEEHCRAEPFEAPTVSGLVSR